MNRVLVGASIVVVLGLTAATPVQADFMGFLKNFGDAVANVVGTATHKTLAHMKEWEDRLKKQEENLVQQAKILAHHKSALDKREEAFLRSVSSEGAHMAEQVAHQEDVYDAREQTLAAKETDLAVLEHQLKKAQEALKEAEAHRTVHNASQIAALKEEIRQEMQQELAEVRAAANRDKQMAAEEWAKLEKYRGELDTWSKKERATLQEHHENQLAADLKSALALHKKEKALEAQKERVDKAQAVMEEKITVAEDDPEEPDLWDFDDEDEEGETPESQHQAGG